MKMIEGLTPNEVAQLKIMEDRLRRERVECDKLEHTINAIMGDKVMIEKSSSPPPTRARKLASSKANGQILSPRYRPPPTPPKSNSSGSGARRRKSRDKAIFTNFSRAPRFGWQKYEKPTKGIAVDITHLSSYRKKRETPSPCSYNIPTSFTPYAEKPGGPSKTGEQVLSSTKSKSRTAEKNTGGGKRLMLDDKGDQETMQRDLLSKQRELDQSKSEMAELKAKLMQLSEISSTLQDNLRDGKRDEAQDDALNLDIELNKITSPDRSRAAFSADADADNVDADADQNDDVAKFVESSVVGNSFKIWEKSPQKWKGKYGYERTGHWVTVRTRSGESASAKKPSKKRSYLNSMQGKSYEQRALQKLFDVIDTNGDGFISGRELNMFLAQKRDTEAGKAMIKHLKRARPVHKHGHVFNVFDQDHDNHISLGEFCKTLTETEEKRELTALFKKIDANDDGVISGEELHAYIEATAGKPEGLALQQYVFQGRRMFLANEKMYEDEDSGSQQLGHHERSKIFQSLDENDDGEISLHEFVHGLEAGLHHIKQEQRTAGKIQASTNSEKLLEIFRYYCNFGERFQEQMSVSNWTKMLRDCDLKRPKGRKDMLLDSTNLTLADLGIIFNQAARYQITHTRHGLQNWSDLIRDQDLDNTKANSKSVGIYGKNTIKTRMEQGANKMNRRKPRITYSTMLYGLRLVCKKRYKRSQESKAEKDGVMKKLLTSHILPLYGDDIAHAHSAFTKMEVEFAKNMKQYEGFVECYAEDTGSFAKGDYVQFASGDCTGRGTVKQAASLQGPDGPTTYSVKPAYLFVDGKLQKKNSMQENLEAGELAKPVGAKSFFETHDKGLKSIFDRYASMDAATADNDNPELQYIAHSSWRDVEEMSQKIDWLEFSTFMQDFGVVPKLASRLHVQRIFNNFSQNCMDWHDKDGKAVVKGGESSIQALSYDGFKKALGVLSMVLFTKKELEAQCPTPRSKLELLFFKMDRPVWLLRGVEKRMTNAIDVAVRESVMRNTHKNNAEKFMAPTKEVEDVKNLLADLEMTEDQADIEKYFPQ